MERFSLLQIMNSQLKTVWKLIPHHLSKDGALAWTKSNGRIAVGWGWVGDIYKKNYFDAKDIANVIKRVFEEGNHPYKNSAEGGLTLWSFAKEMQIGDYVIVSGNRPRQLVVKVTGDYQYSPSVNPLLINYEHQREVEITYINPDELWQLAGAKTIAGRSPYATLARCANQVNVDDL
jgi:predicted Mrr-cat superfamily restriction endonuclease